MTPFNPLQGVTLPATCTHGVEWAYPCASCGRPYTAPPQVTIEGQSLAPLLERIADALERIARRLEEAKP